MHQLTLAFAAIPALILASPASGAAEPLEQPPAWRAAQVLPPALASGPDHRVEDPVRNDGVMNIYRVSSRFGALEAQSFAELEKRVHELHAIAKLQELEGSQEFGDAIAAAGGDVLEGAKALATDPVNTVSGAVSGVGAMFRRAGNSLTGAPRSQYEDGALRAVTGFSAKKREFAAEFGVDVYSSNPLLQERLDRVARAAAAGNLSASAALALVGGGAGAAISVTKGAENLNEMLRETPPSDLREMNESRLAAMGVGEGVADLFMSNTVFSPSYQTRLVDALTRMDGVGDREVVVKIAVRTETDDLAMFRQRQARMYAAFHLQVAPLERFVQLGDMPAARTRDGGRLVLLLPVDHVAWTEPVARSAEAITAAARAAAGGAALELWLGGGASPGARAALEAAGWTLRLDNAAGLVGPG
jgi:hypothetical protein